jgi:hypothetical protein
VMTVVLNQADLLSESQRAACVRDLRRLLAEEGLPQVEVLTASAVTGDGIDALRERLAKQVAEKRAAARRLAADVSVAAQRLSELSGTAPAVEVGKASRDRMTLSLAEAAGVPVVTEAVARAWRLRGAYATGWPALSWLAKLRADPLRRLHLARLGVGSKPKELTPGPASRTSLPSTTGVQQARVESAVRAFADEAASGLRRGWADAIKAAARSHAAALPDALDRSIAQADLDLERHRRWWQEVRMLQWVLIVAVLAGLGWLGAAFVLAYLQLPPLPEVTWWNLPAPTVLLLGGVLAGLLVGGVSRIAVEVGARRRARMAQRVLRRSIAGVVGELVVTPVVAEQDRYQHARAALERATT